MAMESDHEQNSTTEVHFKQHLRGLRESKCSSSAGKPNGPSGTRISGFCPGYRAKVLEIAWGKKNSSSKMFSKRRHQILPTKTHFFLQKSM